LTAADQAILKAAVQDPPQTVGVPLANWNWKAVRHFLDQRFQQVLGRSSCFRTFHRLGFVWKRPKKRFLKADTAKRALFVREYAALCKAAQETGATIVFVDEAHFYADADLRGKWVLQGEPALVDSCSPRYGEKTSYYSAVCLETGGVDVMPIDSTSRAETSAAFLRQLRAAHPEPLIVIWDNGPAHSGDAIREFLQTPDVRLLLVRLPAYSPDYNADEHIWGWVRAEVTGNVCFGTKAKVRAVVDAFFGGLATRAADVMRRCRTRLQSEAELLTAPPM
jgi:transposase